MKEKKEAEKCLLKAINLNQNYSKAYNSLGLLLGELKKFNIAEICYKKAIKPNCKRAKNNLGIILFKKGKIIESEKWISRIINNF